MTRDHLHGADGHGAHPAQPQSQAALSAMGLADPGPAHRLCPRHRLVAGRAVSSGLSQAGLRFAIDAAHMGFDLSGWDADWAGARLFLSAIDALHERSIGPLEGRD